MKFSPFVIRFHDYRHSAASIMLSHGIPPIIVAGMLGHSLAILRTAGCWVSQKSSLASHREASAQPNNSLARTKKKPGSAIPVYEV
ncbi:MAG: hypothetical protein A2029_01755 [Chloroflexi bacterium RBG_19FT_COMBO_47_9]|nr:MAG: hypothetical protein A2029_01755 [Chloroflexi bacterium RBG_19FT_COMBO_47_9]